MTDKGAKIIFQQPVKAYLSFGAWILELISMSLTIDVYFSENCGSYHELRENLDRALAELTVAADVRYHTVYYDDAVSLGIHGSPSVRINGRDAFESDGAAGVS